jgi:hypothetical protein
MRRPDCGLQPDCEPVPFSYIDLVTSPDAEPATRPCRVAVAAGSLGALRLGVTPRSTRAGAPERFGFKVTAAGRPVAAAIVRFAGRRVRTDADGRAHVRVRFRRPGRYRARASRAGMRSATAHVRVLRRAAPRRTAPRLAG